MNLPPVKRKYISWRNFERIYPLLFSSIGLIAYRFIPKGLFLISLNHKFTSIEFLYTFITVEATLFGFLLTVLSIILQMNNKGVKILKEKNRYGELISFGKSAVVSSLILLIISLLLILLEGNDIASKLIKTLQIILGTVTVYNVLSTIRFTNIFFVLSKSN